MICRDSSGLSERNNWEKCEARQQIEYILKDEKLYIMSYPGY